MNSFVRRFVKVTGFLPAQVLFKRKTYYTTKKAKEQNLRGGCLIVSNHKKLMDFPLWMFTFPGTTIYFLAAEVLYNKSALMANFLDGIGGVRVDRDVYDMSFIAESEEILAKGNSLLIFPEGQLPKNRELGKFHPSAVYIALRSGAPIVPVVTDGVYGIDKQTSVLIGEKFYISDYCNETNPSPKKIEELNGILRDIIQKMTVQLDEMKKRNAKK